MDSYRWWLGLMKEVSSSGGLLGVFLLAKCSANATSPAVGTCLSLGG